MGLDGLRRSAIEPVQASILGTAVAPLASRVLISPQRRDHRTGQYSRNSREDLHASSSQQGTCGTALRGIRARHSPISGAPAASAGVCRRALTSEARPSRRRSIWRASRRRNASTSNPACGPGTRSSNRLPSAEGCK
jgi:hypothetical protein